VCLRTLEVEEQMTTRRLTFIALAATLVVVGSSRVLTRAQGGAQLELLPEVPPHLVYIPLDIAERMLEVAGVTKSDVVYDLGCGDGRVAIMAAKKYGARGVGVDNNPNRIAEAQANAERDGVTHLVRFVQQDTIDLSAATVVTMTTPQSAAWLSLNGLLQPLLTKQLKAGSRIVTNFVAGSMKNWKPDRVDRFTDARGSARAILYLWKHDGRIRP
jgi:predicted RNA methylase